ncbi:MAG: TetR/AcrR family transcriptional regulator [Flammeovirgaceae bacterium]
MPRTKQFNESEVLDKALALFWRKGFNGTAISDLVSHLGINRASLYDTFGGKRELFMAALERYQTSTEAHLIQTLEQDRPVLEIIEQILASTIAATKEGEECGCFMMNCTTELASVDQEIAKIAAQNIDEKEELFFKLITKGQANGEISQKHHARALARYLFTTFSGLKAIAQSQASPEMMEDVKQVAMDSLRG